MRRLDKSTLQASVAGHEFAIEALAEKKPQQLQCEGIGRNPRTAEGISQFWEDSPSAVSLPKYGLGLACDLIPSITILARHAVAKNDLKVAAGVVCHVHRDRSLKNDISASVKKESCLAKIFVREAPTCAFVV
jgi:hypothetical protein